MSRYGDVVVCKDEVSVGLIGATLLVEGRIIMEMTVEAVEEEEEKSI